MKKSYKLFGVCLSVFGCTLLMQSAVSAATIKSVTNTRNVGIYEKTDNVGFNMVLEDVTEDTKYLCQLNGVDNTRLYSEYFTVPKGTTNYYLNLGKFNPGWYKMTIYKTSDTGTAGTAWSKFTAFTVTEPFSERTTADTPFAVDLAGQYGLEDTEKPDYAEALRLMGVGLVRERGNWATTQSSYEKISGMVNSLENEGLDCLELWAESTVGWNGDLRTVYNMQKGYAQYWKDKVDAWEIWNEPELDDVTPDLFAAYYKAAALGVHDVDTNLTKIFGGLCASSNTYREALLANDILDYSDVFNVHTHRSGGTGSYYSLTTPILENGRALSVIYGGRKPLWVTESGIRLPVDSSNNLYSSYLTTQARYAVTSAVEAFDSAGVDEYFYFLGRHYIEDGREFGMFSSNDMPYPSTASYAALTYHLGEAKYKGELRYLPDGVKGYMFNNGEEDVAVIWTKSGKSFVQLRTDRDVTLVSLVGEVTRRRYGAYHGIVNVPVTSSPVIVKMGCESDHYNYFKKTFPEFEIPSDDESPQRVIMQPVWQSVDVKNDAYVLNSGKSYTVNLNVYNFSDTTQKGFIDAYADKLEISANRKIFSILPGGTQTLTFELSLSEGVRGAESGKIIFTSTNSEVSESVCRYTVDISELVVDEADKVYFDNFWDSAKWIKNTSATSYTVTSDSADKSITFSHTFSGGDRWSFPKYNIEEGSLSRTSGLVFDRTITNLTGEANTKILMWGSEGTYIANLSDFTEGTEKIVVPWEMFDVYQEGEVELDPSKINCIAIGFNTNSETPADYTISNFGYFTSAEEDEKNTFGISGIESKKVYKKGSNLIAKSNIGDGEVSVYLNFEPYYDYEIADGEVIVSLDGLSEGAYNLIIAEKDEFNHRNWAEKNFYVGIRVKDRGTFY